MVRLCLRIVVMLHNFTLLAQLQKNHIKAEHLIDKYANFSISELFISKDTSVLKFSFYHGRNKSYGSELFLGKGIH